MLLQFHPLPIKEKLYKTGLGFFWVGVFLLVFFFLFLLLPCRVFSPPAALGEAARLMNQTPAQSRALSKAGAVLTTRALGRRGLAALTLLQGDFHNSLQFHSTSQSTLEKPPAGMGWKEQAEPRSPKAAAPPPSQPSFRAPGQVTPLSLSQTLSALTACAPTSSSFPTNSPKASFSCLEQNNHRIMAWFGLQGP